MNLVEGKYGHGGVIDTPDHRDYQWELGKSAAPFDWNIGYDIENVLGKILGATSFKLPVNNQGESSSCGGQAWSKYGEVLSMIFDGTYTPKSAKFIYAQTFVTGGGSAGRDNCNLVKNQGWGSETDTPSRENGNTPSEAFMERKEDITQIARQNAVKDEAISYANTGTDIDTIAHAIQSNYGVVLGIHGQNNGSWLTNMPVAPSEKNTNELWSHWVYAGKAKLINGNKYIGILNSWGDEIGEAGWQWLSEDYFKTIYSGSNVVFSGWTLIYDARVKSGNWIIDLVRRFYTLFS